MARLSLTRRAGSAGCLFSCAQSFLPLPWPGLDSLLALVWCLGKVRPGPRTTVSHGQEMGPSQCRQTLIFLSVFQAMMSEQKSKAWESRSPCFADLLQASSLNAKLYADERDVHIHVIPTLS